MRLHDGAADFGDGLRTPTHVPERLLQLVPQQTEEPFPVQMGKSIINKMFFQTLREISEYEHLTVGPAKEHADALRDNAMFGSGVLMVVERGVPLPSQPSQPEMFPI